MSEALKISGIGIFIVFFALVFISITISFIGKFFTREKKVKNAVDANKTVAVEESSTEVADGELNPELIAVITAAVSLSYGPAVRINSIGVLHRESQYGMQGRMKIMSSHKLK